MRKSNFASHDAELSGTSAKLATHESGKIATIYPPTPHVSERVSNTQNKSTKILAVLGLIAAVGFFIACAQEAEEPSEKNPSYVYNTPTRPDGDTSTSALDLMTIFQVTSTGTDAVSDTFKAVSAFVKSAKTKDEISKGIHLGDYIDLPSLTVAAYEGNGAISVTNAQLDGTKGAKLRIIVVGINSFSTRIGSNGSTNASYVAPSTNNSVPHVVFQFQNLPGTQKMNSDNTNAGGYAETPMRKYLVPVDGVGGNFLDGLKASGVPTSVLWGPKRSMAINYNDRATARCNVIKDLLWLPTVWEVRGTQSYSALSETKANQARLEYYDSAAKLKKYNMSGTEAGWWNASPPSESSESSAFSGSFCDTLSSGGAGYYAASTVGGCAPAFCVK
jgi:hypothetical protein